ASRAVLSWPSRSIGCFRSPRSSKKELSAPFEGLSRYVKTSPERATGRIMGRKKTVLKNRLNRSQRRVSKTAASSVSGSLITVLSTAKSSVFRNADQKRGSLRILV